MDTPDGLSQMYLRITFSNDFLTLNGVLVNFNIFYQTEGDSEQQTVLNPSNGDQGPYEMIISDLLPNRLYIVSVDVVTQEGTSGRSITATATTYPLSKLSEYLSTFGCKEFFTKIFTIYSGSRLISYLPCMSVL